jgi:hypothetical protein
MVNNKAIHGEKRELSDYCKEPNTQIALDHLHQLKSYFFCIIDELETLSKESETLGDCLDFRFCLRVIEEYFLEMSILNFPYEFNKGTYFSIIENISKSLQNTKTLSVKCLKLNRNEARKSLVKIQKPVELALDFTIELIVELENSIKNKKTA